MRLSAYLQFILQQQIEVQFQQYFNNNNLKQQQSLSIDRDMYNTARQPGSNSSYAYSSSRIKYSNIIKQSQMAPTFSSSGKPTSVFNKDNVTYEHYSYTDNKYIEKRAPKTTNAALAHQMHGGVGNGTNNQNSNVMSPSTSNPHSHPYSQPYSKNMNLNMIKEQSSFLDSVEVDYRQKTFELMRKNTELELNIKQSRGDVASLENEVARLSTLLDEVFQMLTTLSSKLENNENAQLNNHINEMVKNNFMDSGSRANSRIACEQQMKNIISNIDKCKLINSRHGHTSSRNPSQQNAPTLAMNAVLTTSKLTVVGHGQSVQSHASYAGGVDHTPIRNAINSSIINNGTIANTSKTSHIGARNNHNASAHECDCETHYNEIIAEYKSIMDTQHANIMRKDKNNQTLKQENHDHKLLIDQLNAKTNEYEANSKQYENIIKQLQDKISQLITQQEQSQLLSKKYIKQEEDICEYKQSITDQLATIATKESTIVELVAENQALFQEKEKISKKYKQEILHFQEMEKLVEEKLIEVEYEMNFYKKQRAENFERIRKLKEQLKQYKTSEQKKYYSFGQSHKDAEVQVKQQQLQQETNQSYAQIIVGGDKTVTIKNKNPENVPKMTKLAKKISIEEEQLLRYSINSTESDLLVFTPKSSKQPEEIVEQEEEAESPARTKEKHNSLRKQQEQQKQNWQIQCFEQSIKTLLNENNRLKQTLMKLYRHQQQGMEESEISKQIELEMKILLAAVDHEQAEYHTEGEKGVVEGGQPQDEYGTVKKQ